MDLGTGPVPPLTSHQVARFLLQLALILVVARGLAEGARRLRLPAVLGELVAGLFLGPTILGAALPSLSAALFPQREIPFKILEAISWVGMVLLLFLIGSETDIRVLRRMGRATLSVASINLVVSFGAGLAIGWAVPASQIPPGVAPWTVAAFLATAFAISAMPVIAKILHDMGLAQRDVGVLILGASVFDDTVGWVLLAVISAASEPASASAAVVGLRILVHLGAYLAAARWILYPLLKRTAQLVDDQFRAPGSDIALFAAFAFGCAALTDALGIHAVFGAFTAGLMARQVPRLRTRSVEGLTDVVGSILAPIFFAFVGLKVNLLQVGTGWFVLLVFAAAVGSKILGCWIGGRLAGLSHRVALVVGAGMSARGAMGLVVAVVGLSMGILSPPLYSVLVVMAVGTSLLAPLLLRQWARDLPVAEEERMRARAASTRRVLDLRAPKVLVPTAGGPNARAAAALAAGLCRGEGATLRAVHVAVPGIVPFATTLSPFEAIRTALAGRTTRLVEQRLESADVAAAVLAAARDQDLLLVGASTGPRAIYVPPVETILRRSPCHAVVVRAPAGGEDLRLRRILVPMDGTLFARIALEFAVALAAAEQAEIELVHVLTPRALDLLRSGPAEPEQAVSAETERVRSTLRANLEPILADAPRPTEIVVVEGADPIRALLARVEESGCDLMVMGAQNLAIGEDLFVGYGTEVLIDQARCAVAVVIPRI